MSTPTPPEDLPGADGPDGPALDSFAAEEPAAPASPEAPAADAELPDAGLPGVAGAEQPVADSLAAEEPVHEEAPAEVAPLDHPQGSEGLTTAPPPLDHPADPQDAAAGDEAPAPHAAEPPVAPAPTDAPAPAVPAEAPPVPPVVAVPPAAIPVPVDPVPPAGPDVVAPQPATPDPDPAAAAPVVAPVADSSETEAPAAEPAARARRAWLPLTAVGLAVALLAGGTGWLAWQLRQQDRADQAAVDAVAAARDAARLLFSYDHTTLQADFDKGLAVTTGDFRDQYRRTTKEVVTPVATQYKAVVMAEVVEAAVVDARADEVTALVFLNQATTSTRVQGQQVDQSRVRMRLVPRDGRWLVEEVKAL